MTRVTAAQLAPVARATVRGYVAAFDAGTHTASIRLNTPDADPTPLFDVPAWLLLNVGDYVLCHALGSDRVVIAPLDRNARVDRFANPLTTAGQILIAGADGSPGVVDLPSDPTSDHMLRWNGDTQLPAWQDTSIDPPPPVAEALAAAAAIGDTNIKVTVVDGWSGWILIDTGASADVTQITAVGTAGAGGTGFTVSPPLAHAHANGTGIVATTEPPPSGGSSDFPRMTMWWPYWKSRSLTDVSNIADDMVYMGQGGVVLMGMAWGSSYQLPSDVEAKLDIFIAKGIKPYLGLWVGHLTDPDRIAGLDAWNAGNGKWAGIVLDAENQWVQHVRPAPYGVGAVQAKADFDAFMAIFRPLTSQLAVACYSAATSFPNYKYDWWNEVVDTFLPMAYFNSSSDTALAILDTMYRKFNSLTWTHSLKPIIPIMNGYAATLSSAAVTKRQDYATIAFARAGAVHIWRWTDSFPSNMRTMLHGL